MGARGPARKTPTPHARTTAGVPPAPPWLDEVAAEEYHRVAKELTEAEVDIQHVDMAILSLYAQSYSDVMQLTLDLREEGVVTETKRGTPVSNPKVTALNGAYNRLRHAAMRLGFSPLDRLRVPIVKEGEDGEDDGLKDFLKITQKRAPKK